MVRATPDVNGSSDPPSSSTGSAVDLWAAAQRHAGAGCLLAVMSALHPELKRFVRVCVREHVLKGMSTRYGEVDRQVTTLLDQKLSAGADTADFAAYLQFADQNWHKYVADLDFHGDLRTVVRESAEVRNKVVRQAFMTRAEFERALAVLRRLAELIAVQQTTKNLIDALVDAADIEVATADDASSPSSLSSADGASSVNVVFSKRKAGRGGVGVGAHVWVIVLLCWVILVLLWTIMALQDADAHNPVKSWVPRLSMWDLNVQRMTPEPTPEPQSVWSVLSSLRALVPSTPTPEPIREPEPATSWWFGWM